MHPVCIYGLSTNDEWQRCCGRERALKWYIVDIARISICIFRGNLHQELHIIVSGTFGISHLMCVIIVLLAINVGT